MDGGFGVSKTFRFGKGSKGRSLPCRLDCLMHISPWSFLLFQSQEARRLLIPVRVEARGEWQMKPAGQASPFAGMIK